MPGVYIGVSNEVVGKTVDTRDHTSPNKPSIANMMRKSCSELKDLWVSALEKQLVDMESHADSYRCGNQIKEYVALLQQELKYVKVLQWTGWKRLPEAEAKKKKKQEEGQVSAPVAKAVRRWWLDRCSLTILKYNSSTFRVSPFP